MRSRTIADSLQQVCCDPVNTVGTAMLRSEPLDVVCNPHLLSPVRAVFKGIAHLRNMQRQSITMRQVAQERVVEGILTYFLDAVFLTPVGKARSFILESICSARNRVTAPISSVRHQLFSSSESNHSSIYTTALSH